MSKYIQYWLDIFVILAVISIPMLPALFGLFESAHFLELFAKLHKFSHPFTNKPYVKQENKKATIAYMRVLSILVIIIYVMMVCFILYMAFFHPPKWLSE
jgi:hypothetical protein